MDLIIKGIIIGIGKILPGISGSLLAITLGIYEKIINSISEFKKDVINNGIFLSKIGIGIIVSIIIFSKIILKCLNNYYFTTMLLFIGMILGSIPKIISKTKITKKNMLITIVMIIIIYVVIRIFNLENVHNHTIENTPQEIIKLIGIGILDSLASIIPGISGTAILMFLGYYNIIIETFSSITQIEKIQTTLFVLVPFLIGFIIGTIYISKIINKLIKRHSNIINIMTIIFMTITIINLLKTTLLKKSTFQETIIGMSLLIIGMIITSQTNKK